MTQIMFGIFNTPAIQAVLSINASGCTTVPKTWSLPAISIPSSRLASPVHIQRMGSLYSIHYGSGLISGHFRQDNIGVGDVVVKDQVVIRSSKHILAVGEKIVLSYLESLVGSDNDELVDASKLEDNVSFY
ncbi:unnamed protein product [Fraxinus pennsylvanica]|uniref:Peptidase A1 domain-containing protein n=1 Tax=Fraxinus pennsylvanica TaxID=56036 RepID=A0AAD2AF96_9LAMI|nr:unnamed protein product [Fraxinus pennsylvanica]